MIAKIKLKDLIKVLDMENYNVYIHARDGSVIDQFYITARTKIGSKDYIMDQPTREQRDHNNKLLKLYGDCAVTLISGCYYPLINAYIVPKRRNSNGQS